MSRAVFCLFTAFVIVLPEFGVKEEPLPKPLGGNRGSEHLPGPKSERGCQMPSALVYSCLHEVIQKNLTQHMSVGTSQSNTEWFQKSTPKADRKDSENHIGKSMN